MAKVIYTRIEERRSDLGVTKQRMAEKLGISYSALDNKLDGTSQFTLSEIKQLSEWWHDSIDDLLSEETEVEAVK